MIKKISLSVVLSALLTGCSAKKEPLTYLYMVNNPPIFLENVTSRGGKLTFIGNSLGYRKGNWITLQNPYTLKMTKTYIESPVEIFLFKLPADKYQP